MERGSDLKCIALWCQERLGEVGVRFYETPGELNLAGQRFWRLEAANHRLERENG
jgi:hypothetical protein